MKNLIVYISIFISLSTKAQSLSGTVVDNTANVLPGVLIYWQNKIPKTVISNEKGKFTLKKEKEDNWLIFKSIGYKTDSVFVTSMLDLKMILNEDNRDLEAVVIKGSATFIDKISAIHTEVITSRSLAKAACCNLSESFETNASVSVSYTDAVTGAKQIQLLGLSGLYVQNNIENIPNLRGLATTFGLNYVPGTWIQSIDVAKGIGSVVNGNENIAGAINVELKKPEQSERLLLNFYVNHLGRGELNLNLAKKLSENWSVGLLTHGSGLKNQIDNNRDGFMDLPTYNQINIMNRWKYLSDNISAQFGFKILQENRLGGQKGFASETKTPSLYGFTNKTNRYEFFSKTAKLFQEKPYRGLGLIVNAIAHHSDSKFGFKPYIGTENTFYSNLIYQDKIGNTNHTYKTGLSFLHDDFNEKYGSLNLQRNENVPGVFFEYTFNHLDRTILLIGFRNDFHNLYGNQFAPRLHFKQDIGQNDTWRLSIGRGFRTPNPLADYYGNLVSSRTVKFLDVINPEIAWTAGTAYVKTLGKFSISAEYYYTKFEKQWVIDMEHSDILYFYMTKNKSYNSSGLLEFNYAPTSKWDFKLAYRYTASKVLMGKPYGESVLLNRMFLNRDRILFNMGYALPYDKWKADFTLQWNGKRRIPNHNLENTHTSYFSIPSNIAPSFVNINSQITRTFPKFEIYVGGENLSNFKQKDPILDAKNPFGNNFDAGVTWGPVLGAVVYSGFRYKIL